MKTSKYARDQWSIVRGKLLGADAKAGKATNGGGEEGTPEGKSAKKGTARKRTNGKSLAILILGIKSSLTRCTGDDDSESPTKKKATSRSGKKANPATSGADDDENVVKSEPNDAEDE